MKHPFLIALLCIAQNVFSQDYKFFIEKEGKLAPLSETEFNKSIDHTRNVEVYVENESGKMGVIFTRKRDGKLTPDEMKLLHSFLNEKDLHTNGHDYIVINYVTSSPKIEAGSTTSGWYILDQKYLKKLKKEGTESVFFIYNENQNEATNYYARKHINWVSDTSNFILQLLFPAEGSMANAAVIRPDGTFKAYLGEYTPDEVYTMIEELKKMP